MWSMGSPMNVPNERSELHVAPQPPIPCSVFVDSGTVPEGWYEAELLEWVRFPSGWVGRARYKTSKSGGYVGVFSTDNIRQVNPPD